MYALKVEAVGDDHFQAMRAMAISKRLPFVVPCAYFVAEITGYDVKWTFARKFLRGQKDYSLANTIGSRGVYVYYWLEERKIYDIKQPVSWKQTRRYFAEVIGKSLVEMPESDVRRHLDSREGSK